MKYEIITALVSFGIKNTSKKRRESFWKDLDAGYQSGHKLYPLRFLRDKTNGFSPDSEMTLEIDTRHIRIEDAVKLVKEYFA